MRGWIADFFRTLTAPWYWNARKQWYVVRGRRGQCPCHNESDSGLPGETRCEAVAYWNDPARFARRVCPLLQRNAEGAWRCGVSPEAVRPYWGRVIATWLSLLALVIALIGGAVWGTMRGVGYEVTLRQVFWPRAWRELEAVRAEFFVRQALAELNAGKFREAIAALGVAVEMRPDDYATGMLLAQVNHLVRPESVDLVYRRLYDLHPERRDETARVWFRSMLARAQLASAGELARRRLLEAPGDWPVWLHGVMVAARWQKDWRVVGALAAEEKLPAAARAVLALEARVRAAEFDEARRLLVREPLVRESFAVLHRVERLIEFGEPMEALLVLREGSTVLPTRDQVRLVLAAHAEARNRAALEREVRAMLAREGVERVAAVTLVAQHLVRYPNPELLDLCRETARGLSPGAGGESEDAWAALYSAAALAGRSAWLPEIRAKLGGANQVKPEAEHRLDQIFSAPNVAPQTLLGLVRPMSLELNYALLERAMATH